MSVVFKMLFQVELMGPGVQDALLTPSGVYYVVRQVFIANYSGGDVSVKFWQGGTADENILVPPQTVKAGDVVYIDRMICAEAGQTLYAEADAADAIVVTGMGMQYTPSV